MSSESLKLAVSNNEYLFGRFSAHAPENFEPMSSRYIVNYTSIKEIPWVDPKDHLNQSENYWRNVISKVKSTELPEGVTNHIIEEKDFSINVPWGKGVLYYSDPYNKSVVSWSVLRDYKTHGVLFTIEGTSDRKQLIDEIFNKVISNYKPDHSTKSLSGPNFLLPLGVIPLERRGEEKVYVRFENRLLKLKIEIETSVVSKIEKTNLIERLSAALASNFAPGVSVEKIRVAQRSVAGMKGDEVVMRGKEGNKSELSFAWRFNGEKNSASAPRMSIEMESPDEMLEQKLVIWDALLDSIQPVPQ